MSQALTQQEMIDQLQKTPINLISSLDWIKDRFLVNYNQAHKDAKGELLWQQNIMAFNQVVAKNDSLMKADPVSALACILRGAIYKYSFVPSDGEVYIMCYKGVMCLQEQVGLIISELMEMNTNIEFVYPAVLVFEGDEFSRKNGGDVEHVEKYQSKKIIRGYVCVQMKSGRRVYFVYEKSHWESWRACSPNKNGDTWLGGIAIGNEKQPQEEFLKTKMLRHASRNKCWKVKRSILTDDFQLARMAQDPEEKAIDTEFEDVSHAEAEDSMNETKHKEESAAPAQDQSSSNSMLF